MKRLFLLALVLLAGCAVSGSLLLGPGENPGPEGPPSPVLPILP